MGEDRTPEWRGVLEPMQPAEIPQAGSESRDHFFRVNTLHRSAPVVTVEMISTSAETSSP